MTTISHLPDDLIGNILSRIPVTSLSVLRSTCKKWNYLSKTHVFGKKAARNQQFLGFMLINYSVYSMRFNFQGIPVDPSVMKIQIRELEDVVVTQVYQYDGLLLCVTNYHSCLVWNPYLGQTRWIKPTKNSAGRYNSYALGYDDNKNNRNHKILRFLYDLRDAKLDERKYQIEVYSFSSNAWRIIDDMDTDSRKPNYHTSVSVKGNTYFLDYKEDHLLCFDFTAERFGTHLPLPFKPVSPNCYTMTLSCVRDEKLVLLHNHSNTLERIKIWISTKIEPNEISWCMFFKVDENHLPNDFPSYFGSIRFFIDEEKKIAVLFRLRAYWKADRKASIIGEDRFINYINIGEAPNNNWDYSNLLGSYVPSLVQVKLHQQETEN